MKKNVLVAIFILMFMALGVLPGVVQADHDGDTVPDAKTVKLESSGKEATSAVVIEQKIEYALPYPGILPDHPLYFLKTIRDQILEHLISDPIRKIEFYVLQGDKKINAGIFLMAKNNVTLASNAFEQSSTSMGLAIKAAEALKTQGRELPGYLVEKLENALIKHKEVLSETLQKASDAQKASVTKALEVIGALEKQVADLK